MKKKLMTLLLTGAVMIALPALAQEATNKKPVANPVPLEQRYEDCMGNTGCPGQKQWQIMKEMDEQMRQTFRHMNQMCHNMNYRNCLGPQAQNRRQWYKMHAHMHEMMEAVEARPDNMDTQAEELQQEEPAAGDKDPKGSWWDRWRNGAEQEEDVID